MSWNYGCETGKRRYPTAADVRDAIAGAKRHGVRQKAYRCTPAMVKSGQALATITQLLGSRQRAA